MTLQTLIAIWFATVLTTAAAAQQSPQTVIRDASGRTIGTATTDSQGTTVLRDSRGSTTGTASRDGQGTTTFRNDRGMTTGTAQSPFERR
jgi:hypothetical protein